MTENLGKCDYDEEIRKRTRMVFVPNWFSVDLKVGVSGCLIKRQTLFCGFPQILTITLEESDVFAAWIAVKELIDIGANGNASEIVDLKGKPREETLESMCWMLF